MQQPSSRTTPKGFPLFWWSICERGIWKKPESGETTVPALSSSQHCRRAELRMLGAMVNLWSQNPLRSRLLLLATLLSSRAGHASRASLFEFSVHVQELNPASFAAAVESQQPWVIDCYSPGCPHCTRFKPTVSGVAVSIVRWFRCLPCPTRVPRDSCYPYRITCLTEGQRLRAQQQQRCLRCIPGTRYYYPPLRRGLCFCCAVAQ